jgi:dolichyl-phosphate-mannose--protein O-mannosyl transferase
MRLPPPGPRRTLLLALTFALAAAAFRLPRLGMPNNEVFDEVYHAKTALQYLNGERPLEWVHPPTSKLLIAVGVELFGYHAWAWRLAPALAGILLAPVFFLFARRVLASERAAILATALLLCDGVYLVQSRIAMTNIFAVLFQVSAALFVVRAVLPERMGARDMLLAGLCLGLALSTRWTSLWAWGFLGLVTLAARRLRVFAPLESGLVAAAFVAVPAVVYTLSYVPWMLIVLPEGTWAERLAEMVREQRRVWTYHATLDATHPYFSPWYTWPWLVRPTWYYYYASDFVRGVIALGNPAIWWASVPVTLWALSSGLADKDPRRLLSGLGFCLLYLPWGLSPRTLNFSHYLFEAIPYACLSLAALLDRHWDASSESGTGLRGRLPGGETRAAAARLYVLVVALLFLFLFPVLTALPIPPEIGLRPWTWFRTWI